MVLPNADFVIEGDVDPKEPLCDEGPVGGRGDVQNANSEVRTNEPLTSIRHSSFDIRHSSFDRPATIVGIRRGIVS
jgi:3-polyprenyl-4-hydroxybenzoate decarboxylase